MIENDWKTLIYISKTLSELQTEYYKAKYS